jgi:Peptidase family M23
VNDEYKKLYKLSDKCAKLQTKNFKKAETLFNKIDAEVNALKQKKMRFELVCNGTEYGLPVRMEGLSYFRPLFKMETHRLIKEVSADDTNAVDFDLPLGTEVFSVSSGVVTALQCTSVEGGNDEKFAGKDNYLYIYNKVSGLVFCYRHLERFNGFSVGSVIAKGDKIGKVGLTGYVITPHLHFAIYSFDKTEEIILKSLPIKFG